MFINIVKSLALTILVLAIIIAAPFIGAILLAITILGIVLMIGISMYFYFEDERKNRNG